MLVSRILMSGESFPRIKQRLSQSLHLAPEFRLRREIACQLGCSKSALYSGCRRTQGVAEAQKVVTLGAGLEISGHHYPKVAAGEAAAQWTSYQRSGSRKFAFSASVNSSTSRLRCSIARYTRA